MNVKATIGIAAAIALQGLMRRGSLSRVERTRAGSTPHDEVSGREAVRTLLGELKVEPRDLAAQWVDLHPSILGRFYDGWTRAKRLSDDGYIPTYPWNKGEIIDILENDQIPFTLHRIQEAIDDGSAAELLSEIPDPLIPILISTAEQGQYSDVPPASAFDNAKENAAGWLVHSTNATDLDYTGFRFGVEDMSGLAYTGGGFAGHGGPGYNFAYEPESFERYGFNRGRPKYGKWHYLLWVPSYLVAWHYGDQEQQAIFWGPSARNIIEIREDDGSWMMPQWQRSPRFSTVEELANWVDSNWEQYRHVLVQGLERSRRRVARGWSRERGGDDLRGDLDTYRGPRMGSPAKSLGRRH